MQLLQGTKLEDDFLSHSTNFLSRGSLSTHACQHNGRSRRLQRNENYQLFWQDGQRQTKDDRWQTEKMEDIVDEPANMGDSGISRDLCGVVACKEEFSLLNDIYFDDLGR